MSSEDHFNWPMPNRNETMYLSTIRPSEIGIPKRTFYNERSPNLNISDIDKARPYYPGYQYNQKETYVNRNDDISGSQPKKLHQPLDKIYYGMRNDDIPGAKPQCHKFVTTRTSSNPLNPEYKLSQVDIRVATPPKFIRDNIAINDIDGARPNPYTRYNIQRKTNYISDIEGAKPKKEWFPQGKQSNLDVKDINSFFEFHTTRQTDPLSPRYRVANQNNELYEYGKIDNKVMVRHPKEVNKVTSLDLRTGDIEGAQASTSTQHLTKISTKDTFLKTQDIPGAQIATLKKGMTTNRHLDPLWPAYVIPGHSEPAPVYTRNAKPTETTQKYGARSTSWIPKNELATPAAQTQNSEAFKDRSSGNRTPPPPQSDRKLPSPLLKSGEAVMATSKLAESTYVPSRPVPKDNVEVDSKQKMNFETKKAVNSPETYQKSVKSFFGVPDETKSAKNMSMAEKFDKFISK